VTVQNGITLCFTGTLIDRTGTAASNKQLLVLPYAGATFAVADLSTSNTASSGTNPYRSSYSLSKVFRSGERLQIPDHALTMIAGQSFDFSSLFASNTLSTTPMPEPASLLLLAGTVSGAFVAHRRRRRGRTTAEGSDDV